MAWAGIKSVPMSSPRITLISASGWCPVVTTAARTPPAMAVHVASTRAHMPFAERRVRPPSLAVSHS